MKNLTLIFITVLLFSCNLFQEKSPKVSYGEIKISINSNRTLLPELDITEIDYEISFTGDSSIDTIVTDSGTVSQILPRGEWLITINAVKANGDIAATGSQNVVIPDVKSVNIPLSMTKISTGEINLVFNGVDFAGMGIAPTNPRLVNYVDKSEISLNLNVNADNFNITGTDITSGSYLLVVDFIKDGVHNLQPYTDGVQVFDNTLLNSVISLEDHFDTVPLAPENLAVSEVSGGILLTWSDSATNESNYVVEKSTNGVDFNVIKDFSGYGRVRYMDTDIDLGVEYHYRVKAENIIGGNYSSILTLTTSSDPKVIYVKSGATGDGTSWDAAYGDIQAAIDLAATYSVKPEVWVAAGTYTPQSRPNRSSETDQRYNHFALKEGVTIYGGFAGTETSKSQRDFRSNKTVLSGDFNDDDTVTGFGETLIINNNSENAYNVFYMNTYYTGAYFGKIDGFTITGGNANSALTASKGGGIYLDTQGVVIENCVFSGNHASLGGGIYNIVQDLEIDNCVIAYNSSSDDGGGIYSNRTLTMFNSIIYGNSSSNEGAALYLSVSSDSIIYSSMILENFSSNDLGVIYDYYSILNIYNSIVWGGSAKLYKSVNSPYSANRFINSIIEDSPNTLDKTNTDLINIFPSGLILQNINDPDGLDEIWMTSDDGLNHGENSVSLVLADDDYLQQDINDKDNDGDIYEKLPYDILGEDRILNRLDIGPYESELVDNIAPDNVSAVETETASQRVIISWTEPSSIDISKYEVTYTHNGNKESAEVDKDETELLINDLNNDEEYSFTIKTIDYSNNASAGVVVMATPAVIAPLDFENVVFSPKKRSIHISWTIPVGYIYDFAEITWTPADGQSQPISLITGLTEAEITGLNVNTEYSVTIKTANFNGDRSTGANGNITTLSIPTTINDSFDTGDISQLFEGDWLIDSINYNNGTHSIKSRDITHDESTSIVYEIDLASDKILNFSRKVSSESGYDYLRFSIDDVEQEKWAGELEWLDVQFQLTAGTHVLKWEFTKDGSVNDGDDCAWIDTVFLSP